MAYTPTNWVDGATPVNAANLNKLEQGLDAADQAATDATALAQAAQPEAEKGQVNGYASLDASGKVPLAQLPPVGSDLSYDGDWAAPTTYQDGDVVVKDGVAYLCVGGPTTVAPDIAPWGAGAMPPFATKTITDWNLAVENGWYKGYTALNAPLAGAIWFIGLVTRHDSSWVTQEVWDFTLGQNAPKYRRMCLNGTWGPWHGIGPPIIATSLPANPVDGQEAILVDSLTAPTYHWRFRYNGGGGARKWEYIGGSPKVFSYDQGGAVMDNPAFATASGWRWWVNPAGSVFPVPRSGDYHVRCKLYGVNTHATNALTAFLIAAIVTAAPSIVQTPNDWQAAVGVSPTWRFTLFTAGLIIGCEAGTHSIGMGWQSDIPGNTAMHGVWVEITPVRVS